MVMVAEALSDENKSSRGGQKGDQTGKEIVVREFIVKRNYKWDCVLRCKNKQMAETAAGYAKRIAECSKFGYNQSDRWSGPKAIEKVGGAAAARGGDCAPTAHATGAARPEHRGPCR